MTKNADTKRQIARLAWLATEQVATFATSDCHALISCSKSKGDYVDLARNLYISPLYRKSVLVAENWGLPFSILSAKHGLVAPDQTIEPYDLTLKGASSDFKSAWGAKADAQIRTIFGSNKIFIVFAGDDYLEPLIAAGEHAPLHFVTPLKGLSLGNRLLFLNECIRIRKRQQAITQSYELFEQLKRGLGLHRLRELLATDVPKQGVYFFFDDAEPTAFSDSVPRLVRVGTHGVSAGSTATLRNRLRTHLGTRNGGGNHRASVFRLHIGRAIIERDGLQERYPQWGKGQSAPRNIIDLETPLESLVSEYISNLRVLYIPVADASGTESMRATIERQFIAMFTESHCAVEHSSPTWLGRFSEKPTIRDTGLWNVRDVGAEYDFKFIPLLTSLLNKKNYLESMQAPQNA